MNFYDRPGMEIPCKGLSIANLPRNRAIEVLKTDIVNNLKSKYPVNFVGMEITFYPQVNPDAPNPSRVAPQMAVISNILVDYAIIQLYGLSLDLPTGKFDNNGREKVTPCIVTLDFGDERNANGEFKLKMKSEEITFEIERRTCENKRLCILDSTFRRNLQQVTNFKEKYFYMKTRKELPTAVIKRAGKFEARNQVQNNPRISYVRMGSTLECKQAILYLHQGRYQVCNEDGTRLFSTSNPRFLNDCIGLAPMNHRLSTVPIFFLQRDNGYVPFSATSELFFKRNHLVKSRCWKCETRYELIGIDRNENWVAARCTGRCRYDKHSIATLDVMSAVRPFVWRNDTFTRLRQVFSFNPREDELDFTIVHQPMREEYESAQTFRHIVLQIMQEEFSFCNYLYERNQEVGMALQAFYPSHDDKHKLVHATVKVDQNEIICEAKSENIVNFQIFFNHRNGDYREVKDAQNFGVINIPNGKALVTVCYTVDIKQQERDREQVLLIPRPSNAEYRAVTTYIDKWVADSLGVEYKPENFSKRKDDVCFEEEIMDEGSKSTKTDLTHGYKLADVLFLGKKMNREDWLIREQSDLTYDSGDQQAVNSLHSSRNEKQKEFFEAAKKNFFAVLCGPPGTGKTTTCGKDTLQLWAGNKSAKILLTAPTNFATSNLANTVAEEAEKFSQENGQKPRILRVYSNSKSRGLLNSDTKGRDSDLSEQVECLHCEVMKEPNWWKVPRLSAIELGYIQNLQFDLLQESSLYDYYDHRNRIETEILSRYDIIACTVQSLGDGRIRHWNNWLPKNQKIYTIMCDEAGQLKQPSLLLLMMLSPVRLLLYGDENQLEAIVNSYSAELAGLCLSQMSWLQLRKSTAPRVQLLTQYRSHWHIRKLFSSFTYNNMLVDGPNGQLETQIYLDLMEDFSPKLEKRVVVFDHRHPERAHGTSIMNLGEAHLAHSLVTQILSNNIPEKDVVVITFYEAQNKLIKSLLGKDSDVRCCNVDGFQGRQGKIVILCLTRSWDEDVDIYTVSNAPDGGQSWMTKGAGFLANQHRLNVAVSRAQELLFILGNTTFFRGQKKQCVIQHFMAELFEKGSYSNLPQFQRNVQIIPTFMMLSFNQQ